MYINLWRMQPEHHRGLNFDLGQPYRRRSINIMIPEVNLFYIYIKLRRRGRRLGTERVSFCECVCVCTRCSAHRSVLNHHHVSICGCRAVCAPLFLDPLAPYSIYVAWCGARALLLLLLIFVLSWASERLPRDAKAAAAAFLILRPPAPAHPWRRNPLTVTISNWNSFRRAQFARLTSVLSLQCAFIKWLHQRVFLVIETKPLAAHFWNRWVASCAFFSWGTADNVLKRKAKTSANLAKYSNTLILIAELT